MAASIKVTKTTTTTVSRTIRKRNSKGQFVAGGGKKSDKKA